MDAARPSGGRASGRGLTGPAIAGPAPLRWRPPTPLGAFAPLGWWSPLGLGVVPPFRCGCSRSARPRCWAVVLAGWPVVGLKCSRCDGLLARAGGGVRRADNGPAHLVLVPLPLPPPRRAGRGWPPAAGRGPCAVAAWPLRPGARKAGRARQKKQRARRMGAVIGGSRSGAAAVRPCRGPRLRPAPAGASMPPPSLQCGPRPVRPSAAAGSTRAPSRGPGAPWQSREPGKKCTREMEEPARTSPLRDFASATHAPMRAGARGGSNGVSFLARNC